MSYVFMSTYEKHHIIHDLLLRIFIPTQWFLSSNKKTWEERRVLESWGFDWGHQDGFFQGKVSLESTDFTEGGTNRWMDEFWWSTPPKMNECPLKGTISVGNTSSNHWISGDIRQFLGQGILLLKNTNYWFAKIHSEIVFRPRRCHRDNKRHKALE